MDKLGSQKPIAESAEAYIGRGAIPTAPLPDPIAKNIDTIVALHTRAERDVPRHQRLVETITAFCGRPAFLYSLILVISLWMLLNTLLLPRLGVATVDPPPFEWLEWLIDFGSLLITTGVLIRQTRQDQLAEQRAQLMLQLNLLSEQKIAKLIALVEELRNDLPIVENRRDPEAEVMQQAADPHLVLDVLQENLSRELSEFQRSTSVPHAVDVPESSKDTRLG
jgi:uncharacterized membrane protein